MNTIDGLHLVHLLDGWAGPGTSRGSSTWSSPGRLVELGDDGVADGLHLLLLLLELLDLGQLVGVQPLDGVVALVSDQLLVVSGDLVSHLLIIDGGLHVEAVALKTVLGGDPILLLVVLVLELLSVVDHALDLLLGQTALVVGDGDLVLLPGALVADRHVQDAVGVDVEGDLDLRDTTGSGGNAGQVKLSEEMVVLGHGPLPLVHLDGDGGLVVAVGSEGLGLLGGDGGVPLDEGGHHATSSLDTERQRSHVQQEKVRDGLALVSSEDGGLDSGTVGHGLVRVDGLVELLPVEEVLEQLLDLGDPGGASDQHDVVDGALVHLGVPQSFLHGLQGSLEEVRAELLEPGPGDAGVEINSLKQRVDLNVGLSGSRQGSLGSLASSSQPPQSSLVTLDVLLMLPLELVDEVVHHPVVEVLSTKMSVTSS